MTRKQYKRMSVFARRMANIQPPRHRKRCRYWVSEMLDRMNCENFGVHYPHIIDWDNSESWTREECEAEPWKRWCHKAHYLCDYLKADYGLAEYEPELTRKRPAPDGGYETALLNRVQCCICAAVDIAVAPSAGVYGYTVGALRKMWGKRPLPKWVTEPTGITVDAKDDDGVWL